MKKQKLILCGAAALAGAYLLGSGLTPVRADAPAQVQAQTPDKKTDKKTDAKPAPAKKLTGAELYQINCNRCHPERYATEWTPAQWKTLVLHMRVRANIPAAQAKAILKYLQEDAGN
jgi:cytochrome c5